MRISTHFLLQEFIPEGVYREWGEFATRFIDDRMVYSAIQLRRIFGPLTINTYPFGGSSQWRGFRTGFSNVGSRMSQHRYGRAIDMSFREYEAEEVRQYILKNQSLFMDECGISRIEKDVDWVHIDCAYTGYDKIEEFEA